MSNSQNKKSRGLTDIASCMQSDKSRCSCLRNQQTCTRLCRCINSNNQGLQEKGAVSKRKGCTCRSLNKVKARRVSCKDHVERKSRCLCLHVGVKCDSVCRCTWQYIVIHGYVWQYLVIHSYTWQYIVIHGCTCQYVVIHGYTRQYLVIHGYTWQYMVIPTYTR